MARISKSEREKLQEISEHARVADFLEQLPHTLLNLVYQYSKLNGFSVDTLTNTDTGAVRYILTSNMEGVWRTQNGVWLPRGESRNAILSLMDEVYEAEGMIKRYYEAEKEADARRLAISTAINKLTVDEQKLLEVGSYRKFDL